MKKIILLFLLIISCFFPVAAFGENETTPAAYSVEAVFPENQLNKSADYFHLLMKPKQTQTVFLNLFNQSSETQTYLIAVNQATTNKNGNLVYNEPNKELDSSLEIPITKIANPKNKEITVKANTKEVIEIEITMPDEPIKGILLGGIVVTAKDTDKENERGITIRNRLSYTIALMLTENEDEPVYGNESLKISKITPRIINGKRIIEIEFRNSSAAILKDISIEGKVLKKGNKSPIAKNRMDNIKIAPNSVFTFLVTEKEEEFSEGDYSFAGMVNQKKVEEKKFTISKKMAKKLTDETKGNYFSLNGISISIIIIGLMISAVFIKSKKKRRRDVD